eukprot:scaffold262673_cov22-Tisochrysis_lutea.AAC.2
MMLKSVHAVQEAMRAASAGLTLSDEDGPSDPTAFSWADNGAGSSSSSRTKWWQRRFQEAGACQTAPRNPEGGIAILFSDFLPHDFHCPGVTTDKRLESDVSKLNFVCLAAFVTWHSRLTLR